MSGMKAILKDNDGGESRVTPLSQFHEHYNTFVEEMETVQKELKELAPFVENKDGGNSECPNNQSTEAFHFDEKFRSNNDRRDRQQEQPQQRGLGLVPISVHQANCNLGETMFCEWETCTEDPNRLRVGLSDLPLPDRNYFWDRNDFLGPGRGLVELVNHIEGLPFLKSIELSLHANIIQVAIPIVEACRRSTATELEVKLSHFRESVLEFLSHEACREAITKVTVQSGYSQIPAYRNLIAALGNLMNVRSLGFYGNLGTDYLSHLSQVKLSNTCRELAIICHPAFYSIERDHEANALVSFLRLNNKIDCLDLHITSMDSVRIVTAHLLKEKVTKLGHLTWKFWDEAVGWSQCHHQLARQTPSIFTVLSSIEFTQGLELAFQLDQQGVAIVQQLAGNMKGSSRQLVIHDALLWDDSVDQWQDDIEPEDHSEELSSLLLAAVGPKSKLLEFTLETYFWELEAVAKALAKALPYMTPRLQKFKLVLRCRDLLLYSDDMETPEERLHDDKTNTFIAGVLAVLGQITALLDLKSFELELQKRTISPDVGVLNHDTKHKFISFVAEKSIQRICAEDTEFPQAALPKAFEQLQSNPHLNSQYSATMLFHCLRKDEDLQTALTQFRAAVAEDRACPGRQMATATQETIEILPGSATTKRKLEDASGGDSKAAILMLQTKSKSDGIQPGGQL